MTLVKYRLDISADGTEGGWLLVNTHQFIQRVRLDAHTDGMLLDALHFVNVQGFGAVFFRKNHNQIFSEGGLWDNSLDLYTEIPNAVPVLGLNQWKFENAKGRVISKISFRHIERDLDLGK